MLNGGWRGVRSELPREPGLRGPARPHVSRARGAAATDPDSAALWSEITGRGARTMREYAATAGELCDELSDAEVIVTS